jgi:hypothetical protein
MGGFDLNGAGGYLVERWFALLTEKQLRRGVHRSTKELESAIHSFIQLHNTDQNPSSGTKPPTKSSIHSLHFLREL